MPLWCCGYDETYKLRLGILIFTFRSVADNKWSRAIILWMSRVNVSSRTFNIRMIFDGRSRAIRLVPTGIGIRSKFYSGVPE